MCACGLVSSVAVFRVIVRTVSMRKRRAHEREHEPRGARVCCVRVCACARVRGHGRTPSVKEQETREEEQTHSSTPAARRVPTAPHITSEEPRRGCRGWGARERFGLGVTHGGEATLLIVPVVSIGRHRSRQHPTLLPSLSNLLLLPPPRFYFPAE